MPLLLVALFTGFVARQFRAPTQVPLSFFRLRLLGVALVVQALVVPALKGHLRTLTLFFTLATALTWLISNIVRTNNKTLRWALLIIAAGTFMNVVPTLSHGAMPVDREALRSAGFAGAIDTSRSGAKHVIVDQGSAQFFGDRFPIRRLHCVASIGDFVEMLGIALLITAVPRRSAPTLFSRPAHGPLTT